MSKLDYCNSILTGLPACILRSLQMIQNRGMARIEEWSLINHRGMVRIEEWSLINHRGMVFEQP